MPQTVTTPISRACRLARPGVLLPLALYLSWAGPAQPAGYGLKESTATGMGAAYAGSSATGTDASYLYRNPASLAAVGEYDSSVGLIAILPSSNAAYPTALTSAGSPAGGNAGPDDFVGDAFVTNIAARMRVAPRWAVGLALYVPWGLSTDYAAGWAGRYYADKTRFAALDIQPTLSFQPTDRIALGAGLLVQYAKGTLSNAIDMGTLGALFSIPGSLPGAQDGGAVFTADDWSVGFTLGATADLGKGVIAGVSYRSAVSHRMTGPLTFTLDSAGVGSVIMGATGLFAATRAATDLTTPDMVNLGLRAKLSERFSALVEADWTNWSRFHELRVDAANPLPPDDVTEARWKDAWFASVGAEFQPDERWTWRAGLGLDRTPVPDSTRNPRIPDGDRTWLTAGFSYRASDSVELSLSYAHLFVDSGSVNLLASVPGNALRGNLAGRSEASAEIVGLQLNYRMP